MKNRICVLSLSVLFLNAAVALAQDYSNTNELKRNSSANHLVYTIYSVEYTEGKKKIDAFITAEDFVVINQSETKDTYEYQFTIAEQKIAKVDSFCNSLGYISNKKLDAYNNEARLAETKLELERLELKKVEFEKMLVRIDSVKSERYYQHWEKIRDIDLEIYTAKKKITSLASSKDVYYVSLSLNDEQTSPNSSKINYVHMPGVEYAYLFTENPKAGVSYAMYQGVFVKYLFTKGKSYCSLGALKAVNPVLSDTSAYDEMFNFTIGQDWYSRHLGRGNNKFLNLYIGYEAGVSMAHNSKAATGIPFVSPSTGVELFKNKFLLFDTNVNYYQPLTELNRDMRGWKIATSVNFTF